MSEGPRDYYEVLGVTRRASATDIHRAFRSRARRFHPDSGAGGGDAARFRESSEAFAVLHDPVRRAEYDRVSTVRAAPMPPRASPRPTFTTPVNDVPRFIDDRSPSWSLSFRIVVSGPKSPRWLSWR